MACAPSCAMTSIWLTTAQVASNATAASATTPISTASPPESGVCVMLMPSKVALQCAAVYGSGR
jgi:hypothetical protein